MKWAMTPELHRAGISRAEIRPPVADRPHLFSPDSGLTFPGAHFRNS